VNVSPRIEHGHCVIVQANRYVFGVLGLIAEKPADTPLKVDLIPSKAEHIPGA
jgi:hypothetical protein